MRVEDVMTPHTCVCRTEEGRLLDGTKHSVLDQYKMHFNNEDFALKAGCKFSLICLFQI